MGINCDFLEKTDVLFFELDMQGRYMHINKVVEDIFGRKEEDMIGKYFNDYVSYDSRDKCSLTFKEVIESKDKQRRIEIEIETKAGEKKLFGFNLYPNTDKDNNMIGMLGMGIDISELKKAQDKLKQAAKEWDETFDAMSDLIFLHN